MDFFSQAGFMPHGHCYLWQPGLLWLQVISNGLIGAAYVAISLTLVHLVWRVREVPFRFVYLAFGAFIVACGFTHFSDIWVIWDPQYWIDGGIRGVTALASVATAVALPPLVPRVAALARGARAAQERGMELETMVQELERLYEQSRELEAQKTRFFANVSHELRTPLSLVLGPVRELLESSELSGAQRRSLEVARRNAESLLVHVEDLLDYMMPGLAGDRLVVELRKRAELEHCPIVVLTAVAEPALAARLLEGGAQDFLAKPFSVPELRARLRNQLSMARTRALLERELASRSGTLEELAGELARRRRELEGALEAARVARDRAERASAVKSGFLRVVSHELRSPLAVIQLQLDRLDLDPEAAPTPAQRPAVDRIASSTSRLRELIENLLQHTRLESGRLAAESVEVDVEAEAAAVVEELAPHAERSGASLRLEAGRPLPALRGDPQLLRIVLQNLAANALKFTREGAVAIRVDHVEGEHRLRVSDTGPGLSREAQEAIFQPFHQLERSRRKHTPGVGLGLAVVREVVEALGGRIELESAPGQGSAFTVWLPSAPEGERA